MKSVIIDDEINCRELLSTMLEGYCEGVSVAGMASNVEEGIALIHKHRPELVFLDIEMPGGDGFAVLQEFPEPFFRVIFVTGYQTEGLEGLVRSALAWIQKPVDLDLLQKALDHSGVLPATSSDQLNMLIEPETQKISSDFFLATAGSFERVPFERVIYVKAQGAYTSFVLEDGEERLASYSLGHYEKIFPTVGFFRIHKSYMVNLAFVEAFESGSGGLLTLKNGTELPIATRRKAEFLRLMSDAKPVING